MVDKTKIMQSHLQTEVGVEVEGPTCLDGWVVDKTKIMQSQLETEVGVEV